MKLPQELQDYLTLLPPSSQNNARSIMRHNFERILKLNPMTAEKILAEKYDIHLDGDRRASDYSEPKEIEPFDTSDAVGDEELAELILN